MFCNLFMIHKAKDQRHIVNQMGSYTNIEELIIEAKEYWSDFNPIMMYAIDLNEAITHTFLKEGDLNGPNLSENHT